MLLQHLTCLVLLYFITPITVGNNTSTHVMLLHQPVATAHNIQREFLTDLVSSSSDKHFLIFDVGLDVPCDFTNCEKYLVDKTLNTVCGGITCEPYHTVLFERGSKRNVVNGGTSEIDVCIIGFHTSTVAETEDALNAVGALRFYNAKSHIIILTETYKDFHVVKTWVLDHLKRYNIYIVLRSAYTESFTFHELCAYCDEGRNEFRLWNTWRKERGFGKAIKFTQSFKGTFFGGTVNVGLEPVFPSVFQVGVNRDGSPAYLGTDYLVLQTLSKYLNFKLVIHPYKTIFMDRNLVDLEGFPLALRPDYNYYKIHDVTAVYYFTGNTIVSASPGMEDNWKSSLDPLPILMVLVSYIVYVMLYWLIMKYGYKESNASFLDTLFHFLGVMFLEPIRSSANMSTLKGTYAALYFTPEGTGLKQLKGIWMLCCFIGISLIFGKITSLASTPGLPADTINSLEDMIQHNVSWIVHPHHDRAVQILEHRPDIHALNDTHHLIERRKLMDIEAGLQYVLAHPKEYIYYFPKDAVEPIINKYFLKGSTKPFHYSPIVEGEPKIRLSALVRVDAPFREAIAMKLLQMTEAGLPEKKFIPNVMDWFSGSHQGKVKDEVAIITLFSMEQMVIVLGIYAFGIILATVAIISEFCYYKYQTGGDLHKEMTTNAIIQVKPAQNWKKV